MCIIIAYLRLKIFGFCQFNFDEPWKSTVLITFCRWCVICIVYALVFTPLELERRSLASRQESFMPLRFKWRIAGLTHKRLEVTVTLPQGIVTERRRGPNRNGKPLCLRYRLNCSNLKVSVSRTILRHGFTYIYIYTYIYMHTCTYIIFKKSSWYIFNVRFNFFTITWIFDCLVSQLFNIPL